MSDYNPGQLEPKEVFRCFSEIAEIPRPSGHEQAISDYLVRFAKAHDLEYYRDQLFNVIIIKEAAPGYEAAAPVILQGHMDMVCEKEPGCRIDMDREGLDLYVEGDYLAARGTTLGGDDGIAIAYALAILASDQMKHPRIEFICTVSEETGMEGASGLDVSMLKGTRMINLDSETEKEMLCGCAGGGRVVINLPVRRESVGNETAGNAGWQCMTVSVTGLTGGHSGTEINRGRANADILLTEILTELNSRPAPEAWRLVSFDGGSKDNAIPRDACADVITNNPEKLAAEVSAIAEMIRKQYAGTDPELDIKTVRKDAEIRCAFTQADTENLLSMIRAIPNGVQEMSRDIPGLVQTSLNLGIVRTRTETETESCCVQLHYSLRSSVANAYKMLAQNVTETAKTHGAAVERQGEYPAWEYRRNSELRSAMIPVYRDVFGKEPDVTVIHAGVECGILADKIPDLDAVSIGPDILDIHTPAERLSISSAKRMYEYVVRVLEKMK